MSMSNGITADLFDKSLKVVCNKKILVQIVIKNNFVEIEADGYKKKWSKKIYTLIRHNVDNVNNVRTQ